MRLTGRDAAQIDLVERYCKEQGLWRQAASQPIFSENLSLNLSSVVPSLAGPRRPQDRVELANVKTSFQKTLADDFKKPPSGPRGQATALANGDVVIAAITSCTNTSNPSVMVAAGLLAKKAVERGLSVPHHVKPSLAPGSRVVTDYLDKAGLSQYLDKLGFNTVGYGCTTCIGNSGPLPDEVASAVKSGDLVVASVLSGNRNFDGRINPLVKANYLASPPLVVAYAIAGTIDANLVDEPLGQDDRGQKVYLKDIWPTQKEVQSTIASCLNPEMFKSQYANVANGNDQWNKIPVKGGELFNWDAASTYIQEPPFFVNLSAQPAAVRPIAAARVLVMVGDSVTTDHISPAGDIAPNSPAGKYLVEHGVQAADFNSYGSRRGNNQVMTRGTFGNVRLRNLLAPGTEGGLTTDLLSGQVVPIYEASLKYEAAGIPLIILAGKDYGMGSSRDWAAKGAYLLGVKAVIAESFERIHRSNLVGMGVLPLQFKSGQTRSSLGLTGGETFDIEIGDNLSPKQQVKVRAKSKDGKTQEFHVFCRIDTPVEIAYYRNGGILHMMLRNMLKTR